MLPFKQVVCRALVLVFAVGGVARAEYGASPQQAAPPSPPSVFDSNNPPPPGISRGSLSGTERYFGPEPDYNTEQRAKWLEICEPKKEVDFKAYRECYENEKRKSQEALRQSFEAKEKGRSGPLRNLGSKENSDVQQSNPAFDVQVESAK